MRWNLKILIILCLLGILVSVYATFQHYGGEGDSFCNFNEDFNCDIVNRGVYSEFFGVPVAMIGLFGYILMLFLSLAIVRRNKHNLKKSLFYLSLIALLITIYLTYLEVFVLGVLCPICIVSAILIIFIFIFSIVLLKEKKRKVYK